MTSTQRYVDMFGWVKGKEHTVYFPQCIAFKEIFCTGGRCGLKVTKHTIQDWDGF